jgi:starvation-inducible DNA-binding protein
MKIRPIKVVAERRSGAQFPQNMVSMPLSYRILRLGSRSIFGRPTVNKPTNVAADLDTPSSLTAEGIQAIAASLNVLLADAFALYLKTKNFHWHVSGRNFRDYHLMLDEQAEAIFETTDQLAERVRKIGGLTIRSIGQIARLQTITDNDEEFVAPVAMLRELMEDNKHVAAAMRKAHELCDEHEDVATASLLENFIDETERRTWFLFEASRRSGDNAE